MSFTKSIFTLQEIDSHFLNQISMADAEFQVNQRNAWIQMGKDEELFAGFAKQNSLFLNEINYSFEISPTVLTFLEKVKLLVHPKFKSGATYYRMAKESESAEVKLKISISIKRESAGKYETKIATTPTTSIKSEEINVIGFSK